MLFGHLFKRLANLVIPSVPRRRTSKRRHRQKRRMLCDSRKRIGRSSLSLRRQRSVLDRSLSISFGITIVSKDIGQLRHPLNSNHCLRSTECKCGKFAISESGMPSGPNQAGSFRGSSDRTTTARSQYGPRKCLYRHLISLTTENGQFVF